MNYEIEGRENLEGLEDEAVIFASNHASYLDGPICAAAMPNIKFYPIRFLAKDQFFWWGYIIAPFFIRLNASIKVFKAGGNLKASLAETIIALKEDSAKIWIFPEGRITRDGRIHKGKRGVAFLHKITGAPIVPVGISGNFYFFAIRGNEDSESMFVFERGRRLKVKIGKPIYSLDDLSVEDSVEKIMKDIKSLTAED